MRLSTGLLPVTDAVIFQTVPGGKKPPKDLYLGLQKMSIGTFLSTINTPGLDLDIETSAGEGTLLTLAAEAHRSDIIRILLSRGADPLKASSNEQKTPLQWATETPQSPRISTQSNRAVTINLLSNSEMSHREQLDAGSKQKSEADNTVDVHESVGDSSKPNTPVDDVDRNAMESSNERLEDHPRGKPIMNEYIYNDKGDDDEEPSSNSINVDREASLLQLSSLRSLWRLMGFNEERRKLSQRHRELNYLPRRVTSEHSPGQYGCGKSRVEMVPYGKEVQDSSLFRVIQDAIHPKFGLNVCFYFKALIIIGCKSFICGIINFPIAIYFKSSSYDVTKKNLETHFNFWHTTKYSTAWWIPFTAFCGNYIDVCLDVDCSTFASKDDVGELTGRQKASDVGGSKLVGHKQCAMRGEYQMHHDLVSVAIVIVAICLLLLIYKWTITRIISQNQTKNYSIMVENPSTDATDPDEWKRFFDQFGEVFMVTVCLKNGPFLQLMEKKFTMEHMFDVHGQKEEKRDCKQRASYVLSGTQQPYFNHAVYNFKESLLSQFMRHYFGLDYRPLRIQHSELVDDLKEMMSTPNESISQACKVFVIFNTESAQRECLKCLRAGLVYMGLNRNVLRSEHLFRSTNILYVREAPEPSDILYPNLHIGSGERFLRRCAVIGITVLLNLFFFGFISYVNNYGYTFIVAILISIFGDIMGSIIYLLVRYEKHETLSNTEISHYTKLQSSRWFITVFSIFLLYDFTEYNSPDFMYQIHQIFLVDAFVVPLLRGLDLKGWVCRNILAPRARTDEESKELQRPRQWLLSERYANLTTSLMLASFYSTFIPLGYFFASIAYFVCYWIDKYCLFRVFRHKQQVDAALTPLVVTALILVLLVHFIFTAYFYAGWPFDMLCKTGATLSSIGLNRAYEYGFDDAAVWRVCDQRLFSRVLAKSTAWWTDGQARAVRWYRWALLLTFICFFVRCVEMIFRMGFRNFFIQRHISRGTIAVDSEGKEYMFNKLVNGHGYVPQVLSSCVNHFLQACDLRYQHYLLGREPNNSNNDHIKYNLYFDDDFDGVDKQLKHRVFSAAVQFMKCASLSLDERDEEVVIDMNSFSKFESDSKISDNFSPDESKCDANPLYESLSGRHLPCSTGYRALSTVALRFTLDYSDKYINDNGENVYVRKGEKVFATKGSSILIGKYFGERCEWLSITTTESEPNTELYLPLFDVDGTPLFSEADIDECMSLDRADESDVSSIEVMTSSDEESVSSSSHDAEEDPELYYQQGCKSLHFFRLIPQNNGDREDKVVNSTKRNEQIGRHNFHSALMISSSDLAKRQFGDNPLTKPILQSGYELKNAVENFKKAAIRGHSLAQLHLALLFATAECLPVDNVEAFKWFQKAVDVESDPHRGRCYTLNSEELALARYNLGVMHYRGQSTTASREKAIEFWRQAQEAGNQSARHALEMHTQNEWLPEISTLPLKFSSPKQHFDRLSFLQRKGGRGSGAVGRRHKFLRCRTASTPLSTSALSDITWDDEIEVQYGRFRDDEVKLTLNPLYQNFGVTEQMWGNL